MKWLIRLISRNAVAQERERCAQIADSMNSTQNIGDRIRYGLGHEVSGRDLRTSTYGAFPDKGPPATK
jgi:hypothetical protein